MSLSFPEFEPFSIKGIPARRISLPPGEFTLNCPLELGTFDTLIGSGKDSTVIKVVGKFAGPVVRSSDLAQNLKHKRWFFEDGVPSRFRIEGFTLDLSDWTPVDTAEYEFDYGDFSRCGIGLYGKGFLARDLNLINAPGCALISAGSSRGGKRDHFFDSPEATFTDIHISKTHGDGMVFAGPHDSFLDRIFICHTRGKGLLLAADRDVNGACDIGFVHAYATDDIAILANAKIKASFLQGDTGRHSGVVVSQSNKSVVGQIESFKVRGSSEDYSVVIAASESQIGSIRIRADAGASGLHLSGFGNSISSLHVSADQVHPDFKHLDIPQPPVPILLSGNQNSISHGRIIGSHVFPLETPKEQPARCFNAKLFWTTNNCTDADDSVLKRLTKSDVELISY